MSPGSSMNVTISMNITDNTYLTYTDGPGMFCLISSKKLYLNSGSFCVALPLYREREREREREDNVSRYHSEYRLVFRLNIQTMTRNVNYGPTILYHVVLL